LSGAATPARRGLELTQKGIATLTDGRPADAANFLQEALGAYRADPESYYYLARAALAGGDQELAAQTLALARQRFPGFCEAQSPWGLFPHLDTDDANHASHLRHDALAASCHAALAKGLVCLDGLRPGDAIDPLLRALEIDPWKPQAYYYLAAAFAGAGEMEKAAAVFAKSAEDIPYAFQRFAGFGDYQGLGLDAKTTIAYYHALGGIYGDIKPFLGGLGPSDGGAIALSQSRSEDLRVLYEARAEDWATGSAPPPARADVFDAPARQANVLLVVPEFIKSNADWVEYDVAVHLGGTGAAHLSQFAIHYADAIHSEQAQLIGGRSAAELAAGIGALQRAIENYAPEVVFFEGSFIGGRQGIDAGIMQDLKDRHGFKLATLVCDIYPPKENYAAYWAPVSDLIVALNEHDYLEDARAHTNVLVSPGVPIDFAAIGSNPWRSRDIKVFFNGARKSYRDMWCAYLAESVPGAQLRFSDQSAAGSMDLGDYLDHLSRSQMVLNNGLVSARNHQMNFRIFETMASGAVLLQQDFGLLREFFAPYVHYAPFTTAPEMAETAQFLIANPDIAEAIAARALAWYQSHYGGAKFWNGVLAAL
jgi:tetratricopeptide (TPR) repeat protein